MEGATATVMGAVPRHELSERSESQRVSRHLTVWMSAYLISLNLLLLYLLIRIWPGAVPVPTQGWVTLGWGDHLKFQLWIEARYLLIVALAGALGSYIHLATSFVDFIGNRKYVRSWTPWYVLRPFIGIALAIVVYFVVRAGLISGTGGAESMSPHGVAATAGMCGLFSKQATDKLREVFEHLFRTQSTPERTDPLSSGEKPDNSEARTGENTAA